MQTHDLRFYHLNKTCPILLWHIINRTLLYESSGGLPVHVIANDFPYSLNYHCTVTQAERIWFTQ